MHTERLADFADLLDDGQEEELEAKLDQVSEDYGCDVVVVTEETLDGAVPQDYADDFFDYNDYGMGEDKSGILFLITMSERKWCISTHGEAIQIFTDAGQEYMTDNFGSYLSDGEYYEGFMKFADLCEEFIIQAEDGEPYDTGNMPQEPMSPVWIQDFLYDISHFACDRICDRADRNRSNEKPDEDCTYEAGCSRLYERRKSSY